MGFNANVRCTPVLPGQTHTENETRSKVTVALVLPTTADSVDPLEESQCGPLEAVDVVTPQDICAMFKYLQFTVVNSKELGLMNLRWYNWSSDSLLGLLPGRLWVRKSGKDKWEMYFQMSFPDFRRNRFTIQCFIRQYWIWQLLANSVVYKIEFPLVLHLE